MNKLGYNNHWRPIYYDGKCVSYFIKNFSLVCLSSTVYPHVSLSVCLSFWLPVTLSSLKTICRHKMISLYSRCLAPCMHSSFEWCRLVYLKHLNDRSRTWYIICGYIPVYRYRLVWMHIHTFTALFNDSSLRGECDFNALLKRAHNKFEKHVFGNFFCFRYEVNNNSLLCFRMWQYVCMVEFILYT